MAARDAAGFTTPIKPVEPGGWWCVFEQRGTYEFILHPFDAERYLDDGMIVDGKLFPVTLIDKYPLVGGWHIHVQDPEANKTWLK